MWTLKVTDLCVDVYGEVFVMTYVGVEGFLSPVLLLW